MVTPALRLELSRTGYGVLDLHRYDPTTVASFQTGPAAGLGFAAVQASWAEGAGEGARWLGSRALSREFAVPVDVTGTRTQIAERLQLISLMLADGDPAVAEDRAMLRWIEQDTGTAWWVRVVRTGTDDWRTNHQTRVSFRLLVRAEDPYLTREQPETLSVRASSGVARGLLTGPLTQLRLSSSQAMGTRTVNNPGDRSAYPRWSVTGPGDGLTLTSPTGQILQWSGTLAAGEPLTIDTRAGTVVDGAGANRYGELAAAPRFWLIPPGLSQVSVILDNATEQSQVLGLWWPRRSFVF